MMTSSKSLARALSLLLLCSAIAACGQAEDPVRVALRARLKQEAALSVEDLNRVRAEVIRAMAGKTFLIKQGDATPVLDEEQRIVVFGMLTEPIGLFDEGVRQEGGVTVRVLNAPGRSANSEIEASRRLSIDVQTFLPVYFRFAHAFPNPEDYSLELVIDR